MVTGSAASGTAARKQTAAETTVRQTQAAAGSSSTKKQTKKAKKSKKSRKETAAATTSKAAVESSSAQKQTAAAAETTEEALPEDGSYTSKEDVALYLYTYGHLPDNFITKKEAQNLGWPGGSLEPYAPGKSIGGSRFGNYEGLLPEKKGRTYYECDIDTKGRKSRGAKRIVWSTDGLIYYTEDHYETFELLYGEE